jgi:hypothetical protein
MSETVTQNCSPHSEQAPTIADIVRFTVLLGVHNWNTAQDIRQTALRLSRIVRHPQFTGTRHDIALLRLVQPVSYSVIIRPVCLPPTPGNFSFMLQSI